jgi:hypothetical protein
MTGRFAIGAVLLVGAMVIGTPGAALCQTPLGVDELAQYRLTTPVFRQFAVASRSIAATLRTDPSFAQDPLFTREIMLSDDAAAAAAALESRLQAHPALVEALGTARLTAREYTKFALTVLVAHVAHRFIRAGVLRDVRKGAAAGNVAFVQEHEPAITALLAGLGIDG